VHARDVEERNDEAKDVATLLLCSFHRAGIKGIGDRMSSGSCTTHVLFRVTAALFPLLSLTVNRPAVARTLAEHPYIDPNNIKSETCLGCHPDKEEGTFIHTAVGSGCESCHQATSEKEKEKTSVTLLAIGGELCAMCHEVKNEPVVHGPYKAGQCLVCHNPHSSNFPRQTRAATNSLCMSCHATGRPDVKVNADARTLSLLDGRTFDLESYQKAPKIGAEHSDRSAAPTVSHPVTGKDPRKPGAELNCISCHDPHASKAEHLLHKATESRNAAENLGLSCHIDINAQVQKPVQHAAVDMGCGTCPPLTRTSPQAARKAPST
jgi:predicted CXXCH cytochrome family protein